MEKYRVTFKSKSESVKNTAYEVIAKNSNIAYHKAYSKLKSEYRNADDYYMYGAVEVIPFDQ